MPCQVDWLGMVQMEQQFTCGKTKTPPKRGSVGHDGLLTLLAAGTDHFDLDAAVLGAAFAGLGFREPLLLRPSLGGYSVVPDGPPPDVSLSRLSAGQPEVLVIVA